jgi:hypothetical protein
MKLNRNYDQIKENMSDGSQCGVCDQIHLNILEISVCNAFQCCIV